jgi:hypothetical protein
MRLQLMSRLKGVKDVQEGPSTGAGEGPVAAFNGVLQGCFVA